MTEQTPNLNERITQLEAELASVKAELAEAEANTQMAIDAALVSVEQWLIDTRDESPHDNYGHGEQYQADVTIEYLRARISSNPLAELQAELAHCKSNHADMVKRNAALMQRPDLKERAALVQELQAKLDALAVARVAELELKESHP